MSTTFAIPNGDEEVLIIGHTSDFDYRYKNIQKYFKDNTPVIAIDNDTTVTNMKELRKYYAKQKDN